MSWLEALILGIIQGITEFLPISSDGHLELGKVLLGVKNADNLAFVAVVHVATTLSIIIVMWKDIFKIAREVLRFQWNPTTRFFCLLLFSAIPVAIIGLFFKDFFESLFNGNLILTGSMLMLTGLLLMVAKRLSEKQGAAALQPDTDGQKMTYSKALIIGIGQAAAVLPGLSRSGCTISSALILGVPRDEAARFSFLMAVLPIMGVGLLKTKDLIKDPSQYYAIGGWEPMAVGFITSLVVGILACAFMLRFVRKGNLLWFTVYLAVVGGLALTKGLGVW